uniref:Uncharacterized protein n=1 Tax=Plectus sambesii TaxID=2011161 RepID=A0A914WRY0_9BILA
MAALISIMDVLGKAPNHLAKVLGEAPYVLIKPLKALGKKCDVGEKSWSTNKSLNVEYKYCCMDHCVSVTTVVLEENTAITEDGIIGQSTTLQDLPALSLQPGYAIHGRSTTVWRESKNGDDGRIL